MSSFRPFNIANAKSLALVKYFQSILPANRVLAEYVWIGGSGNDLRSKTRLIEDKAEIKSLSDLPQWSYDGSSTGQADGHNSDILLKPVKFVPDPFRQGPHVIVLCECLNKDLEPIDTNRRAFARTIFENEKVAESKPIFGLEQEYTLYTADGLRPLGWPQMGEPLPQGPYYCSVGAENAYGRHLSEAHLYACLYSGLDIGGTNAEVMPGQWEYQIGPVESIDAADQLWIARFIMERIAEELEVKVSLDPKPMRSGDWNGAGCHCNFSTKEMREPGGLQKIFDAIKNLEPSHMEHMDLYGTGNQYRMTGKHETAKFDQFSWGVANRGCSVRVTHQVNNTKCGYFEDRRPSANCDPYNVTSILTKNVVLSDKKLK